MTVGTVALAVSGHGFGHAVRCAEIARALLERGARVKIRTDAPSWLFPPAAEYLARPGWPLDVGVAQHDGLDLDVDETRRRWHAFARAFDARAQAEAALLGDHAVDVVLGDIPPLAFAAAARAGLPAVALGNFSWDWIYAAWPDFDQVIDVVRAAYAHADVLYRLPFHSTTADTFAAFGSIKDVPLIARRAVRSRCEVRAEMGLAGQARVVLLSFGGFAAHGLDIPALGAWTDYTFVVTPPVALNAAELPANVVALDHSPADYVSLLAACDVVVTKPGYGIVADSLANRVAVLFTERGPFREYDVLAEQLPRLGHAQYIPRDELLAGHLGPRLDALLGADAVWTDLPINGAEVVAARVSELHATARG